MIRLAKAIDKKYILNLLRYCHDKNYVKTEISYLARKEISDADVDPSISCKDDPDVDWWTLKIFINLTS